MPMLYHILEYIFNLTTTNLKQSELLTNFHKQYSSLYQVKDRGSIQTQTISFSLSDKI